MNIPTHYDVLGVGENDSFEKIKAAYRRLVLNVHPDKSNSGSTDLKFTSGFDFGRIQRAWDCLRDEDLRHEYDDEIQRQREKQNILHDKSANVSLNEMNYEEVDCENEAGSIVTQHIYSRTCRCGDNFELFEDEVPFEDDFVILECNSCGLSIRICNSRNQRHTA